MVGRGCIFQKFLYEGRKGGSSALFFFLGRRVLKSSPPNEKEGHHLSCSLTSLTSWEHDIDS